MGEPIWKVAVEAHLLHLDHPQQPLLLLQALDVEAHNGKVIISAMMKTTMLNVHLMVVTVVETMSTQPIAASVNAWKYVEIHNGKVTISVMMKTTMLGATSMVVIVVVKLSTSLIAPNVPAKNDYFSSLCLYKMS